MTSQRNAVVELNPSISDRVHNVVYMLIANERFPTIKYRDGVRRSGPEALKPQTILIRPQQVGFEESSTRKCGGRLQQRVAWVWIAMVHFDQQVSLDTFEEKFMRGPLRVSRDNDLDQQIDISFLDAVYSHPPEQQSSHGTRVTYRFQADLSPL